MFLISDVRNKLWQYNNLVTTQVESEVACVKFVNPKTLLFDKNSQSQKINAAHCVSYWRTHIKLWKIVNNEIRGIAIWRGKFFREKKSWFHLVSKTYIFATRQKFEESQKIIAEQFIDHRRSDWILVTCKYAHETKLPPDGKLILWTKWRHIYK